MRASVLVVVLLVTLLSWPSASAEAPIKIKIGWVTELTGPWTFFGTGVTNGARLAVDEINDAGGSKGRMFELSIADNATNPAQAVAAARRLDIQEKVLLISGPTNSDTAIAIYSYVEQNNVPFVVPVAAFPRLTRPGTQWTFRMEPDAVGWGYAIIKFVARQKPGSRVAVLFSDAALFRAIRAGLKYQAPRENVSIVMDVVFPPGTSDATVQVAQARQVNPDYIVVGGAGSFDITLTHQLLDAGFKPEQIIKPYGAVEQIINWGPRSIGLYFGTFFDPAFVSKRAEARRFVDAYRRRYNTTPSYIENFGYVTVHAVKEALDRVPGRVTRTLFRDAMRRLKTIERTTGVPIVFDRNGARIEYYYVMQLKSVDVVRRDYTAWQVFYITWSPDVIPVYELAP